MKYQPARDHRTRAQSASAQAHSTTAAPTSTTTKSASANANSLVAASSSTTPETDPKQPPQEVFLSFGLDVGYWQAQVVKSWGAGGPARTVYDTCSSKKCDWRCLESDDCPFRCCENDLFRLQHGPSTSSRSKTSLDLSRHEEMHTTDSTTYDLICRGAGYLDPMREFATALSQYKQKTQNEVLIVLKLATVPGFSAVLAKIGVAITPWIWFVFGVVWSFADWVLAHTQQDKFHEWISRKGPPGGKWANGIVLTS